MHITWKDVPNIKQFVDDVLHQEASDIPQHEIDAGKWYLDEIDINDISIDIKIVESHKASETEIKLTESFIQSLMDGQAIFPLIVLWKDVMLVDGYHRFLALKKLNVMKVKVFRQKFD